MQLAIHHPGRISRLMLSNTAASFPAAVFEQRIAAVKEGGMAAVVDGVLQRFFTDAFRARNSPVLASVRSTLLRLDPIGYIGCCAAVRDANFEASLGSISTPTLVLVGEHDQSTPPDKGRAIAAAIKGAQLACLPVAHLTHPEQPAAFIDLAVPFLLGETLPNLQRTAERAVAARRRDAGCRRSSADSRGGARRWARRMWTSGWRKPIR